MLSRIVKLMEARRALRSGHLEEALSIVQDEEIRDHRKAREIRDLARDELLQRALERRERGELSGAFLDLRSVSAFDGEDVEARKLLDQIRRELLDRDELRHLEKLALERADRLMEAGLLFEAKAKLVSHAESSERVMRVLREIEERMAQADRLAKEAWRAVSSGDGEALRSLLDRIAALFAAHPALEDLKREVGRMEFLRIMREASSGLQSGAIEQTWERLHAPLQEHPWLLEIDEVQRLRDGYRAAREESIRQALERGDIRLATDELGTLDHVLLGEPAPSDLEEALFSLARSFGMERVGRISAALLALDVFEERLPQSGGVKRYRKQLRDLAEELDTIGSELSEAMLAGQIDRALDLADRRLSRLPESREAREERDALAEAIHLEPVSLAVVHSHVRRGELIAAKRCLVKMLSMGVQGSERSAMEQTLREVLERLDRLREEADEVYRAMAVRSRSASELHERCKRLEALESVCSDSPALQDVSRACRVHAKLMELLETARGDLERGLLRSAVEKWHEAMMEAAQGGHALLSKPSWDQQRLALERRLLEAMQKSIHQREWTEIAPLLSDSGVLASAAGGFARRADGLRARLREEREGCRIRFERWASSGGTIASEEDARLIEEARELLPDHPDLASAARGYALARSAREQIDRAQELAMRRDYSGAWDELQSIEAAGPFRTRIFDLKRRMKREIGLGARFFLRVEESGEYLVLAGDEIRIGNARAPGNDLPVLANISSEHARIRRVTSFHEGVHYELHPEPMKPCFVDGRPVRGATALPAQCVLRFGESLEVKFSRPSARSHSAILSLLGGFEVQGVSRVILMKPAGKDGRVIIGQGPEVHIATGHAGAPELFLDAEGNLRCTATTGVTIDGSRVEMSEPVIPGGSWVEAGDVRFAVDPG